MAGRLAPTTLIELPAVHRRRFWHHGLKYFLTTRSGAHYAKAITLMGIEEELDDERVEDSREEAHDDDDGPDDENGNYYALEVPYIFIYIYIYTCATFSFAIISLRFGNQSRASATSGC